MKIVTTGIMKGGSLNTLLSVLPCCKIDTCNRMWPINREQWYLYGDIGMRIILRDIDER